MPESSCGSVTAREAGWAAVSAVFGSLGRVFITLGEDFRIRHASETADVLMAAGAAQRLIGLPVEEVLGEELFGPAGAQGGQAIRSYTTQMSQLALDLGISYRL